MGYFLVSRLIVHSAQMCVQGSGDVFVAGSLTFSMNTRRSGETVCPGQEMGYNGRGGGSAQIPEEGMPLGTGGDCSMRHCTLGSADL
jgi:hypothetical protein